MANQYFEKVALAAGHEAASQVWLLLGASLAQYIPEYPPTPPRSPPSLASKVPTPIVTQNPPQPTPMSGYSFPPSAASGHKISPGRRSMNESLSRMSHTPSSSTLTPTSSTSSSPRHLPLSLSPGTPLKGSFPDRRESMDSRVPGNYALLRRRSLPVTLLQSSSPSDRSTSSLRHVGEGVLDSDSDSSGSEREEDGEGEETANANSSDDEVDLRPLTSPVLTASHVIPASSPLSKVASHQGWAEDEDNPARDEDDISSPSPQSTDTESNSSGLQDTRSRSAKARHKSSTRMKTRSRSSTLASLAARPRPLTRHESHSSICTVTVGKVSFNHDGVHGGEHFRAGHLRQSRQKSLANSDVLNNFKPPLPNKPEPDEVHLTERRIDIIQMEERKFRDTTLDALRVALEEFADEVCFQDIALE